MNKAQDVAGTTDSLIVHHKLMHLQTLLCKLQADFYQNSQIISSYITRFSLVLALFNNPYLIIHTLPHA